LGDPSPAVKPHLGHEQHDYQQDKFWAFNDLHHSSKQFKTAQII
jgi:hypothetical protein